MEIHADSNNVVLNSVITLLCLTQANFMNTSINVYLHSIDGCQLRRG
ncbi:hypothetical protein MAMP_02860 [Methylophaga aminisulfidivorans MP]|uniref:Uncharacterized protein n=1 Tax=Methylophaga aminisulfidivorans MP TaxID=1026882 RepID=F5SVI5_9GAMM|nr:hypothetical protein MAMP_02860 [Methylophaga aminisulfidivorans MP]